MNFAFAKAICAVCAGYGAGIWFAYQAIRQSHLFNRAAWWPSAKGQILESRRTDDPERRFSHFIIRYEFTVGKRIEGNTPRLCGGWFWSDKLQQQFIERYRAEQEVDVYYDPQNPERNCLDRTDRSGVTIMWIIAIGSTTLTTFVIWLWARI